MRSNLWGTGQMVGHVGAILVAGYLHSLALGTGWVWVTGFVLGVLINFLYAAQHELSHATVFANRKANEVFGRLIGLTMIFPRDYDQVMHFAHHTHTQNWEKDGAYLFALDVWYNLLAQSLVWVTAARERRHH